MSCSRDVVCLGTVSYSGVNVNSMTIQSSRNTCIQVSVVQHNETLIVVYKKGPYSAKNIVAIKDCVTMLRNGTPFNYCLFTGLLTHGGSLSRANPTCCCDNSLRTDPESAPAHAMMLDGAQVCFSIMKW